MPRPRMGNDIPSPRAAFTRESVTTWARSLQTSGSVTAQAAHASLRRAAVGVLLVLSCVRLAPPAFGQTTSSPTPPSQDPRTPQQPQTAPQKPEPPPNIPLFPRYRRGLYKNGLGLWVIDGPPQSPPLFTDDPGVPDKGEWEINFTTSADLATSAKTIDYLLVDANYGLLPKVFGHELPLQLKLEGPVSAAKENGEPFQAGLGAFETGVKAVVYSNDHQGIELSVYPQLEVGTGSTFVDKGLADPGQTFIFPVLVSKQFHYVTLVFNGGVETPINDPDRVTIGTFGAAIGMAIRRHFAMMGEVRFESPFHTRDERILLWNAGVLRSLGHYAVLYGNVGRSMWTSDDEPHWFLGVGVKVLIAPDRDR